MTTTPTSGAADLRTAAQAVVDRWDTPLWKDVPATAEYIGRLRAALASAPAQPVAEPAKADSVLEDALSDAVRVPLDSLHADAAYLIGRLREGSMPYARVIGIIRERIDAAKAAIRARASHGQAPSGATEEVENLRKALVYAAFALHDAPQYMLAQGIALIDGDTVRVSRDGWTVEASVNPHRQPAPAPPPECETEAEKRAFAFGWFKALESERMKAESVQEDADRLKEVVGLLEELAEHDNYHAEYDGRMIAICPECGEQEGEHRPSCAFVRAKAYLAARAAQKEGE